MEGVALSPVGMRQDGLVSYGDDSKVYAEFFALAVPDPQASASEGRPIFKSLDYIKVRQLGERDEGHFPVNETFKQRFARQWEAYQAKREQTADGTPLNMLFVNEPHVIKQCEPLKIFTVEQLAGLSEHAISRLGLGGRAQVQRAKDYLETAKRGVPAHEVTAKMEAMGAELAAVKSQLEQALQALNTKGEDNVKRK